MLRKGACLACALVLVSGCGSKKNKQASGSANAQGSGATGIEPTALAPAAPSSDLAWNEAVSVPKSAHPYRHSFEPYDPDPPIADPDAVIARFKAKCPQGTTSDTCKDLQLTVERILLDDMIGLRAARETIDRKWYRVAARAETPQLACLGVRALAQQTGRSAEEDAAILAALDHPAPSVRSAVMASRIPAVYAVTSRAVDAGGTFTGSCIDGQTDRASGIKWAGGYPNATYRFFASSPDQRWFTTPDPVEKVLDQFAKAGRSPMTQTEVQAQAAEKMQAEFTTIIHTMKEGEEDKMTAQIQAVHAKYATPTLQIEGAGEIRYVLLAPNLSIAIFKDEVLQATSIVALAPIDSSDSTVEGQMRQMVVREVYGP